MKTTANYTIIMMVTVFALWVNANEALARRAPCPVENEWDILLDDWANPQGRQAMNRPDRWPGERFRGSGYANRQMPRGSWHGRQYGMGRFGGNARGMGRQPRQWQREMWNDHDRRRQGGRAMQNWNQYGRGRRGPMADAYRRRLGGGGREGQQWAEQPGRFAQQWPGRHRRGMRGGMGQGRRGRNAMNQQQRPGPEMRRRYAEKMWAREAMTRGRGMGRGMDRGMGRSRGFGQGGGRFQSGKPRRGMSRQGRGQWQGQGRGQWQGQGRANGKVKAEANGIVALGSNPGREDGRGPIIGISMGHRIVKIVSRELLIKIDNKK